MKALESLKWRASVRKFDNSLKVSDKDLETIKKEK